MQDPYKAVATPVRRRILRMTWDRELSAGEICANFSISWPAVSQHLRVLRESGLLIERRDGRKRYYLARKEAIAGLRQMLESEWEEA